MLFLLFLFISFLSLLPTFNDQASADLSNRQRWVDDFSSRHTVWPPQRGMSNLWSMDLTCVQQVSDGLGAGARMGYLEISRPPEASFKLVPSWISILVSTVRLHSHNGKFLKSGNHFSCFLTSSIQQIPLQPLWWHSERYWSCREEYSYSLPRAYSSLVGHLQSKTWKRRKRHSMAGQMLSQGMQRMLWKHLEQAYSNLYIRGVPDKLMFKLWWVWVMADWDIWGRPCTRGPEVSESRAYLGWQKLKYNSVLWWLLLGEVGASRVKKARQALERKVNSRHVVNRPQHILGWYYSSWL